MLYLEQVKEEVGKMEIKYKEGYSILRASCLVFVPTILTTAIYVAIGHIWQGVPSLVLFFIVALCVLFPFELGTILRDSKKEFGEYSLKSAFVGHEKMPWIKILLIGFCLFGFAGLMSITLAVFEDKLMSPLSSTVAGLTPAYFNWTDIAYMQRQFPRWLLVLTCAAYFICNTFIGPVVEELFFRGFITAKLKRYGWAAPVITTVLFSLYHLWLPFNNLFRIAVFLPASLLAYRMKNIYISLAFHCMCNLFSSLGFIFAVLG